MRRRLQHQVGVGATQPKGAYSSQTRLPAVRPRLQAVLHFDGQAGEIDMRIGSVEPQAWDQLTMVETKRQLHETGDSGCRFQMTEIGFYRSNQTRTVRIAV